MRVGRGRRGGNVECLLCVTVTVGRILISLLLSLPDLVGCSSLEETEPQESEEPFVAPPGLAIPPDVELVSALDNVPLLHA